MLTPLAQILIYLSCTFLLGLAMGWVIWKYRISTEPDTDIAFWKERLDNARAMHQLSEQRNETLEREKETLKAKLASAKA